MNDANGRTGFGRGPDGKWAPGNQGGNPYHKRVHELRERLSQAMTDEDMAAACEQLKADALAGRLEAIREFLDRTVGPARVGADVEERLAVVEAKLAAFLGDHERVSRHG